ncbi:MAG: hypothetical protein K6E40_10180 [Desulfovibrio sp.]|nr:hypothetical protein [Desulfovibrio sp.]
MLNNKTLEKEIPGQTGGNPQPARQREDFFPSFFRLLQCKTPFSPCAKGAGNGA